MGRARCQECDQPIEFEDEMAGQAVACPSCGYETQLAEEDEAPTIRIPAGRKKRGPSRIGAAETEPEPQTEEQPVEPNVPEKILGNIQQVIFGKDETVRLALVACFAEGHILLEDVPGVAKTMLGRAIAQSIGSGFKRIQCTPDLLPNDVTGSFIFNPKSVEFEFRSGPIFAQVVLADEVNRTTPRTQSALLEAMSEQQVTVDGVKFPLEAPFLVIATQNPIDHEGTFPLPEAQLDRFLLRLHLGYPSLGEEDHMLTRLQHSHPIQSLGAVATAEEVCQFQQSVREVELGEKTRSYLLSLVRASRDHHDVRLGGSPRASIGLFRASQALAAIRHRDFVLPDDVKELFVPVMAHRLILRPESRLRNVTPINVLEEVLHQTEVPTLTAR